MKDEVQKILDESGLFKFLNVDTINHKPHPFMIGTRHVTHASKHHGGMLGQATLDAIPCSHPKCVLSHDAHTSDKVAFLQLTRDATNDEANDVLKQLAPIIEKEKVNGFVFVESDEKFRIT